MNLVAALVGVALAAAAAVAFAALGIALVYGFFYVVASVVFGAGAAVPVAIIGLVLLGLVVVGNVT